VSKEYGISEQTIKNWIEKVNNGILDLDIDRGPNSSSTV
jgi:transposase